MDLDDHWSPGPDHPAWAIIQQHQLDKKILNNIKVSRILQQQHLYLQMRLVNLIRMFM
jgi:hypothetical protein